jgi:SH3-like domain-containing protein
MYWPISVVSTIGSPARDTAAMKQQQGKFILFDVPEFASWLDASSFSRVIHLLQCHHTWNPSYEHFHQTNHFDLLEAMERAHLERGFSEIAQNLTTFPDGLVAVCRSIDKIPAGIKGANRNGICIENVGNFDGLDPMAPQHRDCIVSVFALLCKRFHLSPDSDSVQHHHWWDLNTGLRTNGIGTTKTCPGTLFFSGNSVVAAEANFIPLISWQLAAYAATTPALQAKALYSAEVGVATLNVRAQPTTSAMILKQLNRTVDVSVYEERDGWSRIDPANASWVDNHFLARTGGPIKAVALYAAQVTASGLNVRTLPSLSGGVTGQLNSAASLYVYEERNGWCRVDPADSLWVNSNYLARTDSPPI